MSTRTELPALDALPALSWVRDGSALLLAALRTLDDGALDAPSVLPGWSRRHLLAHVASNAEALGRLLSWARTGVESRMYSSPEQRAADIEAGALLPAPELRDRVARTVEDLDRAFATQPDETWAAQVITAQGRTVPASEVPWMRAREVCVHALDLGTGLTFADLPAPFCGKLVGDVAGRRAARGDGPALSLTAGDHPRGWEIGGEGAPVRIALPLADLAAWLTGRSVRPDLPTLPDWL